MDNMKIALLLENESFCNLDHTTDCKTIKMLFIDTLSINKNKIEIEYIPDKDINYISLLVLNFQVNCIIVSGISDKNKQLFEKMHITVECEKELNPDAFLKNYGLNIKEYI